jgi:hypothetical protein
MTLDIEKLKIACNTSYWRAVPSVVLELIARVEASESTNKLIGWCDDTETSFSKIRDAKHHLPFYAYYKQVSAANFNLADKPATPPESKP